MLEYMHLKDPGSKLGIMQVQYYYATYSGTQYKQNTNGYIQRMDNANIYDTHKRIGVVTNWSIHPSNSTTELLN